jgi:hypothetical protein
MKNGDNMKKITTPQPMPADELVIKMTKLIAENAKKEFDITDANYTVGYLQSFITGLALKNPSVLSEVARSIDWMENN